MDSEYSARLVTSPVKGSALLRASSTDTAAAVLLSPTHAFSPTHSASTVFDRFDSELEIIYCLCAFLEFSLAAMQCYLLLLGLSVVDSFRTEQQVRRLWRRARPFLPSSRVSPRPFRLRL